jgi:putative selenate reductase
VFHFGERGTLSVSALKAQGYSHVLVGIGAEKDRNVGIDGSIDVLAFLRSFRGDPRSPRLGQRVAVVGAGDTAMDAARAAKRCRGVREVSIVYRRSEHEMPASPDEYRSAKEEGIEFHFLRLPLRWSALEGLVCSVMTMGALDASGRSAPVATGQTETIQAHTAVGADVDPAALAALGVSGADASGAPLIGDAHSGPENIVKAIASARAAVDAICAQEGGSRAPAWRLPPQDTGRLRVLRDEMRAPAEGTAAESQRCLGCRALCLKCVEVCPNRANTTVRVAVKLAEGFHDELQIVHIDSLCNECGTCATFCPWEGKPYRDKLTVFAAEEDFRDSTNPGFFLNNGSGLVRSGGGVSSLSWSASGGIQAEGMDQKTRTLIDEIARNNSWLLGGTS